MESKVSVVIVTHQSEKYITKCMAALLAQAKTPDTIYIVDSASPQNNYLKAFEGLPKVRLRLLTENVGFSRANNVAIRECIQHSDYVLILNPDAFLEKNFIEQAVKFLENPDHISIGAITGVLYGYDIESDQPTGKFDSTGIFKKWYGKWYDRYQNLLVQNIQLPKSPEDIPAICGALMFIRSKALVTIQTNAGEFFDETFFMYKEDIELSLSLRKHGWRLNLVPYLEAYHCRGWKKRSSMSFFARMNSAKNEIRLCVKYKHVSLIWAVFKYFAVFVEEAMIRLRK